MKAVSALDNLIHSFCKDPVIISAVESLRRQLCDYGFDIFHEFPIQSYNGKVAAPTDSLCPLEDYGYDKTHSILIGNTKHLWSIFINELIQNQKEWQNEPNPLNQYTFNCIESSCEQSLKQNGIDYTVRYTFEMEKEKLIAFQRLCHHSNYAYLDMISHLCIHHEYGPWIAMRAVIVLNAEYHNDKLEDKGTVDVENPCSEIEMKNVQKQWEEIKKVLFEQKNESKPKPADSWKYWLQMRDAYDCGKAYRYSEDQILYHYTTDIKMLYEIVQREMQQVSD